MTSNPHREGQPKTSPELLRLIEEAAEVVRNMTTEEREAMYREQAEGYARAEASWPKPKFKWVNGAKVYDSYEDYCNG